MSISRVVRRIAAVTMAASALAVGVVAIPAFWIDNDNAYTTATDYKSLEDGQAWSGRPT